MLSFAEFAHTVIIKPSGATKHKYIAMNKINSGGRALPAQAANFEIDAQAK